MQLASISYERYADILSEMTVTVRELLDGLDIAKGVHSEHGHVTLISGWCSNVVMLTEAGL